MDTIKTWCIWLQDERGEYTWLEAAWTDDQTAENHDGWLAEVKRCRDMAAEEDYQMRIQAVNVPGVSDLFNIPEVTAEVA